MKDTQLTEETGRNPLEYVNANENGRQQVAYAVKNGQLALKDSGLTQKEVDAYFTQGANESDAYLDAPKAAKSKETDETETDETENKD